MRIKDNWRVDEGELEEAVEEFGIQLQFFQMLIMYIKIKIIQS